MAILARGGSSYARLRFNVGPGAHTKIPIEIAWDQPFEAADPEAWEAEYLANVKPITPNATVNDEAGLSFGPGCVEDPDWLEPYAIDPQVLDQLNQANPVDQQTLTTSVAFGLGPDEADHEPTIEGLDLEY
jgi:hypothetical protein